jgi:hypothetical protein
LILAAILISALPLTAQEEVVELRMTYYTDGNEDVVMRELLDRFEADNPDIRVVMDTVAYTTILENLARVYDEREGLRAKAVRGVPSDRPLAWQALEFQAFVHFGMNTFTDREWGEGTEDPKLFDPADFDAGQWVEAVKAAVQQSFSRLDIQMIDMTVMFVHGTAVGKSAGGSRVVVSFTQMAGEGTKVVVTTDNPADPALEKSVLSAVTGGS